MKDGMDKRIMALGMLAELGAKGLNTDEMKSVVDVAIEWLDEMIEKAPASSRFRPDPDKMEKRKKGGE